MINVSSTFIIPFIMFFFSLATPFFFFAFLIQFHHQQFSLFFCFWLVLAFFVIVVFACFHSLCVHMCVHLTFHHCWSFFFMFICNSIGTLFSLLVLLYNLIIIRFSSFLGFGCCLWFFLWLFLQVFIPYSFACVFFLDVPM